MRYALLVILCALLLALSQGSANAPESRAVLSWDPDEIVENLDRVPGDTVFLYVKLVDVPEIESISFETAWSPWDYPRGCYRMVTSMPTGICGWNEGYGTEKVGSETPATRTLHFAAPPRDGSCIRLAFTAQGTRDDLRATFCLRNFKITDINGTESFLLTPNKATILGGVDLQLPHYISQINPFTAIAGHECTLQVSGGHLSDPASVSIVHCESERVVDLNVDKIESSRITCRFTPALGDTGHWRVRSVNGSFLESASPILLEILPSPLPPTDEEDDPSRQVLAKFERGTISFPQNRTSVLSHEEAAIRPIIRAIFDTHGVTAMAKAFPDWNPADTLSISRSGHPVRLLDMSEIYRLTLPDSSGVMPLVRALRNTKGVNYAEPRALDMDYDAEPPNDPYFNNQWGLENGGAPPYDNIDIGALRAWDISKGTHWFKVGLIEKDGVDWTHPELDGVIIGDPFYESGQDDWHGTATAGIIGAKTDNDAQVAGIDWYAQIWAEAVEERTGDGWAQAYQDAVDAGCLVLNHSYGDGNHNETVHTKLINTYKMGVIHMASMGNEDRDNDLNHHYPSDYYHSVVGVGAIDRYGHRWTQEDPPGGSNWGNSIDVVAPGHEIWTLHKGSPLPSRSSGTSWSAAFVSGVASLMLSVNGLLFNDDIEWILEKAAVDIRDPGDGGDYEGWDEFTGHGYVRADTALMYLSYPWELSHHTATGAVTYISDEYIIYAHGIDHFANGFPYGARRYEITVTVPLPSGFDLDPYVWGTSTGTMGWPHLDPYETITGGISHTDILANDGVNVSLRTCVYFIVELPGGGAPGGTHWHPCRPEEAVMAYTVLGINQILDVPGQPTGELKAPAVICSPNPLSSRSEISFYLPEDGSARLAIYDVSGRLVRELWNERAGHGVTTVSWDGISHEGARVPAGVYAVRLEAGGRSTAVKLTVAR